MGNRLALLIQVGQAVKQAGEGQLGQGELERMQENGAKGRVVEIDGTSFNCLCQYFTIGKKSVKAFDSKVPQRTGRTGHLWYLGIQATCLNQCNNVVVNICFDHDADKDDCGDDDDDESDEACIENSPRSHLVDEGKASPGSPARVAT